MHYIVFLSFQLSHHIPYSTCYTETKTVQYLVSTSFSLNLCSSRSQIESYIPFSPPLILSVATLNFKLLLSTFQPSHVISSLCELYFQHLNQKSFLITVFSNLVFYLFIYLLLLIYTVHYIPYPYLYYTYYILY